jgi:hypothetical protein
LVRGWLTAANGVDDEHSGVLTAVGQDELYLLLKMALIMTWDVVA